MTAALPRRSLLRILGLAPAAAAAGASPASILGATRFFPGELGRMGAWAGTASGAMRVEAVGVDIVDGGTSFALGDPDHAPGAALCASTARLEAAIATAFPAEIAAYRSFAPHLKRRLFRELLERELARLGAAPADTPPTSGTA